MFIEKKLLFILTASFILLGCGGNDSTVEGNVKPSAAVSSQEANELSTKAYEEIYVSYMQVVDELIEEFNVEALEPDIFFAEYGITSVFEEKMLEMEVEELKAQIALDDIFQNELGNEADREIWAKKLNELHIEKVHELEKAYEVMLMY